VYVSKFHISNYSEQASKDVAQTLEKVAESFIETVEILIARVDCDKNSKTCFEQKVV